MSTVRSMLPAVAQPYTEVIVGAALGALVGGYVLKRTASTGALVGAIAGYGLSLTKAKGAFPFRAAGGFDSQYVGDSVTQFPGVPGAADPAAAILDFEEAIPAAPEWPRHEWEHRGWGGRGWGGRGWGGRGGLGHFFGHRR
jgi:hypothetical protein